MKILKSLFMYVNFSSLKGAFCSGLKLNTDVLEVCHGNEPF